MPVLPISLQRDGLSTFDPQLIAKYQRRFPGFDAKIVSLYARGLSTCEIAGAPNSCTSWSRNAVTSRFLSVALMNE